jgi:hypothetical protein
MRATGVYQRTWTGSARANLVTQVPLIARTFPEITSFYPATVNVQCRPMIVVAGYDHRTPPLAWKPGGEDGETEEVFDLVRVRLTIGPNPPLKALLYVGHWSLHRLDPHKQEFLVERFIDELEHAMPVTIDCDRPFVELPYSKTQPGPAGSSAARTIVLL